MKNNQFCRLRSQCVPYTMGFLDVMLHILRHWRTFFSFIINVIRGPRPANLDCRITSGNDSKVECVTSGDDSRLGRWLRVVCNLINTPHSALSCHSLPQGARDYGRSMIEMLGVLAIVGVLSVAGIAGYSKAMTKWKINKAIDEVNTIVSNTKIIFANHKTYNGDIDYEIKEEDFEFMRNFIMPKETDTGVKDKDGENMFQHPFGGEILVFVYYDEIGIFLFDLPREACITLGSYDWKDASNVSVSKNGTAGQGGVILYSQDCLGIKYYGNGTSPGPSINEEGIVSRCKYNNDILPMSPDLAAKGCSCTSNTCQFSVMFP